MPSIYEAINPAQDYVNVTTNILIINEKQSDHSVRYMCLEPVYGVTVWVGEKEGAALERGVTPVAKWKISGVTGRC